MDPAKSEGITAISEAQAAPPTSVVSNLGQHSGL